MLPDGVVVVVSQGTSVVKVEVVVIGGGVVTDRVQGQATKNGQTRATYTGGSPASHGSEGVIARGQRTAIACATQSEN